MRNKVIIFYHVSDYPWKVLLPVSFSKLVEFKSFSDAAHFFRMWSER